MKRMNLRGLSAWKPRPPAAGLKRRIFAARPVGPEEKSFWNLLAPAMVCAMVSWWVMNSANDLPPASGGRAGSAILNHLAYPAFAADGSQTAQNHLASLSFDWTNRNLLSSPIGFTSSTN